MNKKLLLLFSLLSVTQLVSAKNNKKLSKKAASIVRAGEIQSSCFSAVEPICCKRGKRGNRGDRGPRGRNACGLNELFINGLMSSTFTSGEFLNVFSINSSSFTWRMGSTEGNPDDTLPVGMNFNIPIDLDRTKPVTVVMHLLVNADPESTGDQAKIQLSVDYEANNQVLGSIAPATGFKDIEITDDFTVSLAQPSFSGNFRMIQIPISLDPALITGDWAFMTIQRIAPASNEYNDFLYLSTVSVQYSRLCS